VGHVFHVYKPVADPRMWTPANQFLLEDVSSRSNPDAAFHQEAAALIDQPRPVPDQTLPRTMQVLTVELVIQFTSTNGGSELVANSAMASA